MRVDDLFSFMKKRNDIYEKRFHGEPLPWTDDEILRKYRFCNVYREYDHVTRWIRQIWCEVKDDDEHLWFALVIARLLNNIDTLAAIGYPVPWNPVKFLHTLGTRQRRAERVFNPAYIVSTNGHKGDKVEYLARNVLTPMWKDRVAIAPRAHDTLRNFYDRLMRYNGMGSFMAAQVVADIKFTTHFKRTTDWWTFAASGPGSRRGMNRVFGYSLDGSWKEKDWQLHLFKLQNTIDPRIKQAKMPRVSAQDLQNCLCEFDKYECARLGEGRPKQLFKGGKQ
jgi:hypothetical protein